MDIGILPNVGQPIQRHGISNNWEEDVYLEILEAVNQKPGDYSTKLKIQLNPNMRADDATKIVLRFLLKIIKCNEEGIKADLDTEFLHDFRVAIRRTRSALSQIKSVFPEDTTVRFRREFAALGKLSNSLRDLDVYLLNERSYKAMLPSALRADIEPLFDYLRAKRSEALNGVVSNLNSKQLLRTLRDWEAFLNEPSKNSPSALNAVVPNNKSCAEKNLQEIPECRETRTPHSLQNTRDDLLHQLRIECKKLRYLMEVLFQSISLSKKLVF